MRARLVLLCLLALLTGGLIAPAAPAGAAVGDNTWERNGFGDIVASDIVTNAPWEFEVRLESTSGTVTVPRLLAGVYDAKGRFCGQDVGYGGSTSPGMDWTFTW